MNFAASCNGDRELSSVLFTNDIFTWSSRISSRLSRPGQKRKVTSECLQSFTRRLYGFLSAIHRSNFSYFIVSTIYDLNMPFNQKQEEDGVEKRGETANSNLHNAAEFRLLFSPLGGSSAGDVMRNGVISGFAKLSKERSFQVVGKWLLKLICIIMTCLK